ncbi:MAG: exonuclease SbcCD subunit D [Microscillaceae bacterium]|nr:exonuclease SbcCD subunit D [Microscillaceae bacterium]MDW8345369.1 exonuclease SbcCD subunit D [Bacteroidia bacterium]MDW8460256.1 exonuclease SbcCD subunit D [Cytophagales bacterium]
MKILHTADWHLGKIFHNADFLEDQKYILEQITEIIAQKKPDVVLLAGDIYERSIPAADAIKLFDETISYIILTLKVPIIAIAGNHDNPERISYCNGILEKQGLHIFGRISKDLQPIVFSDEYGKVYFYPIPYTEPEVLTHTLQCFDNPIRSHQEVMNWVTTEITQKHNLTTDRVVLILHAFVAGGQTSESERDLYVGKAGYVQAETFANFDYVALGHLHLAQTFLNKKVHYAGSPLKYSFSEAEHSKAVSLVEIGEKGKLNLSQIPLKPKRNLHQVKGKIEQGKFVLTAPATTHIDKEDYLQVTLQTTQYVGNLMSLIQKEYPNTLVLKFEDNNVNTQTLTELNLESLQAMNEITLFESFYQKFSYSPLSEKQKQVLQQILNELQAQEKE